MKVLTSCFVLIIFLISFVRCSTDAYQTNEGVVDVEGREEVHEEAIVSSPAPIQFSSTLINTCRTGFRFESGVCRRVLRV